MSQVYPNYLGKLLYFTNLNLAAIWGSFPRLTMIKVRENSEVVIIYPELFHRCIPTKKPLETLESPGAPAPIASAAPHLVVLRRHGELHDVLDSARRGPGTPWRRIFMGFPWIMMVNDG